MENPLGRRGLCFLTLGIALAVAGGHAAPTWPSGMSGWTAVTVGGNPYVDALSTGDFYNNPPNADINLVGGTDHHGNGPFPTAFYANDGQSLMFRLRVNGDPNTGGEFVWTAILNTDADNDADFGLQLDLSSSDNQVELVTATGGGPGNGWNVTYAAPPHLGAGTPEADWYRFVNATSLVTGDGSHFHDVALTDDYFVDLAFPLATFLSQTGLTVNDTFTVAFSTSTSHTSTLQDLPDYEGWSDPVPVPEPATLALVGVGCGVIWLRRRRRATP